MSPSLVEVLNEAAVFRVRNDSSIGIIRSCDLKIDKSSTPLGFGTFATCRLAVKGGSLACAAKVSRFIDYDRFDRELTAMLQCNSHKHGGIIELWWICMPEPEDMTLPIFVMPVVDGVMLGEWLSKPEWNVELNRFLVAVQLVKAVLHLHDVVKIIHGDLSMKNIMIDIEKNHHLTLIDFGNSRNVARGQLRPWIHSHHYLSLPEALCGQHCDRVLAETHVVGVLLICIAQRKIHGLAECPLPFKGSRLDDETNAVIRLILFWGRARLFVYWKKFLEKAGGNIERIKGNDSAFITSKIGRVGMTLADPDICSRQSLSEVLRHFDMM